MTLNKELIRKVHNLKNSGFKTRDIHTLMNVHQRELKLKPISIHQIRYILRYKRIR